VERFQLTGLPEQIRVRFQPPFCLCEIRTKPRDFAPKTLRMIHLLQMRQFMQDHEQQVAGYEFRELLAILQRNILEPRGAAELFPGFLDPGLKPFPFGRGSESRGSEKSGLIYFPRKWLKEGGQTRKDLGQ